ncbi:MAG: MauE/DoxX family redox-associated membrane protein [Myxococcota bacterium]
MMTAWKTYTEKFINLNFHSYLGLLIRLIIGVTFIYAAWPKIINPEDFAWSISMYEIVPYKYIYLMAIVLPWLEMICALTLIFGFWTRASSLIMCGMLLMFIIALSIVIINEVEMSGCGCFTQQGAQALEEHKDTIGYSLLIRDILMLIGGGYVWLFDRGKIGIDGLLRRYKNA